MVRKKVINYQKLSCVIGYGMVGKATSVFFGIKKHYDINPDKSNISLNEAKKCKFIFICLPTLVSNTGYITKDISNTIKQIEKLGFKGIYIIRSTVYPGFATQTIRSLHTDRIISNPEFLSECTWKKDIKNPPFVLLGGSNKNYIKKIKSFYRSIFPKVKFIISDNISVELAKISMNSYFSTKVIFANQIFDYSQKIKANYEIIKKVLESHPFGPKNHFTIVYKGQRGVKDIVYQRIQKHLPITQNYR